MRILMLLGLICCIWMQPNQLQGQSPLEATDQNDSNATELEEQIVPEKDQTPTEPPRRWNVAIKTAGGAQVWTDHAWRDRYRVQQNALTGHWRLLDPRNVRRAWGTKAQCLAALEQLVPKPTSSDQPQRVVVLLHGLMRTAHCMKPMEASLQEAGFPTVIRFSYASSRRSIGEHAAALREVLESLPAETKFNFIGHSMGCIVVRRLLGDLQRDSDLAEILPRCEAMVMFGPPNQGAAIARRLSSLGLFGFITGKGGLELGPKWDEFVSELATPPFPFAIVAGDLSASRLQNPLVDGSSDYLVSLEEAKLDGSEQFHTVPVIHSKLMKNKKAMQLAVDFIKEKTRD